LVLFLYYVKFAFPQQVCIKLLVNTYLDTVFVSDISSFVPNNGTLSRKFYIGLIYKVCWRCQIQDHLATPDTLFIEE